MGSILAQWCPAVPTLGHHRDSVVSRGVGSPSWSWTWVPSHGGKSHMHGCPQHFSWSREIRGYAQLTRGAEPMLLQCCPTVGDGGTALHQHLSGVPCRYRWGIVKWFRTSGAVPRLCWWQMSGVPWSPWNLPLWVHTRDHPQHPLAFSTPSCVLNTLLQRVSVKPFIYTQNICHRGPKFRWNYALSTAVLVRKALHWLS